MVAILVGIALVIVAVVLWLGDVSTAHALAIFIGIIGLLIALAGIIPGQYLRRGL
jgi:hypothetical protein